MSANIQGMFGRIAGTYDQVNHTLSFNQDIQWRKASVTQLTKDGYVPKKVLDLCAGTGASGSGAVGRQTIERRG